MRVTTWKHPKPNGKYRSFKIRSKQDCYIVMDNAFINKNEYYFPAPIAGFNTDFYISKENGHCTLFERDSSCRGNIFEPYSEALIYNGYGSNRDEIVKEFIWVNRKYINKNYFD